MTSLAERLREYQERLLPGDVIRYLPRGAVPLTKNLREAVIQTSYSFEGKTHIEFWDDDASLRIGDFSDNVVPAILKSGDTYRVLGRPKSNLEKVGFVSDKDVFVEGSQGQSWPISSVRKVQVSAVTIPGGEYIHPYIQFRLKPKAGMPTGSVNFISTKEGSPTKNKAPFMVGDAVLHGVSPCTVVNLDPFIVYAHGEHVEISPDELRHRSGRGVSTFRHVDEPGNVYTVTHASWNTDNTLKTCTLYRSETGRLEEGKTVTSLAKYVALDPRYLQEIKEQEELFRRRNLSIYG